MEITALMETIKPPFSPTSIIYDVDAGTKPFICPMFFDDDKTRILSIDQRGAIFGSGYKNLSPESQVICMITAFFNYAAIKNALDISLALEELEFDHEVCNKIISETIIDYLHRRGNVQWYGANHYDGSNETRYDALKVDLMIDSDNYVSDSIIEELSNIDNEYISNLLIGSKMVNRYGTSYLYSEVKDMIFTGVEYVTLIDFPSRDLIRGRFIDI